VKFTIETTDRDLATGIIQWLCDYPEIVPNSTLLRIGEHDPCTGEQQIADLKDQLREASAKIADYEAKAIFPSLSGQLAAMTEARNRFYGALNEIAGILGHTDKQCYECYAPEAVVRWVSEVKKDCDSWKFRYSSANEDRLEIAMAHGEAEARIKELERQLASLRPAAKPRISTREEIEAEGDGWKEEMAAAETSRKSGLRAGDRFDARPCTPTHWQVRRLAPDGTRIISIWNVYPTTRKLCIDPKHPGPAFNVPDWSRLTLENCVDLAANACALAEF